MCVCVYLTCHSKFCSPLLEHCLFFQDLPSSADGHSMIVLCVCVCVCVCACVSFRIRSAIVAIRENLWVHIQCICRFACFSRHGRIHGTLCVCVRLCVWGYCLYRLLVLMFWSVLACVNVAGRSLSEARTHKGLSEHTVIGN